jgi:beta-galactosidase
MAAIIRRDRNHPSIIMWGIGNEIFEQNENFGYVIARKLVEVCHLEDPTRPAVAGCERIESDIPAYKAKEEFLDALDIVGYNYINRWRTAYRRLYAEDRERRPDWKIIGSENACIYCVRGKYTLEGDPHNRYKIPYFMNMLDVEERWKFTNLYDYVAGDYLWTGIDYLGEAPWPRIGSLGGMLDTSGFEKDGYWFYASQWGAEPIIKLAPHWNWDEAGQAIPVICYTNCEEVELFVNGQSCGVQAYDYFREGQSKDYGNFDKPLRRITTNDLHLTWMVPYAPGEIRAVGKKDGKVYEDRIGTCGEATTLTLEADTLELRANGTDICHVTVRLFDKDGNFAVTSYEPIKVDVEGAGRLLCLNSGNNESHEIGMYAIEMCASAGMLLAYVQVGNDGGEIRITAGGKGITPCSVTVDVK